MEEQHLIAVLQCLKKEGLVDGRPQRVKLSDQLLGLPLQVEISRWNEAAQPQAVAFGIVEPGACIRHQRAREQEV